MSKRKQRFLLFLILILGFILRLNNLSQRSLWTDEFFTIFESTGHGIDIQNFLNRYSKSRPLELLKVKEFKVFLKSDSNKNIKDVTSGLLNTDTHPPLYFWLMFFMFRIFKDNILCLRFFSVSMGLLSIFLTYKVTKYLFNENAAIFSSLFVSVSSFAVRYSQEARAYSLIMVLGLLSWLFILKFERYGKSLDIFCFAIFNCLGYYTHYFYIFITLAQFVYFTIIYRHNTFLLRRFYLAFLCSLLFFMPWYFFVTLKGYNFHLVEWIFGYPSVIEKIYHLFVGITRYILIFDLSKKLSFLFLLTGLFLFGYIVFHGLRSVFFRHPKQSLFCLSLFLMPLLAMFFIDVFQHGALLKQERFFMFGFLGFIPFAGYFLNHSFLRYRQVTCLVIFIMLVSSITVPKIQFGPAPRYTSMWINKESSDQPSVVFVYNIRSVVLAQSYYLDNDIYLIPVSNYEQLEGAIKILPTYIDKIFISRHYHHTDTSLMDQLFLEVKNPDLGFSFKAQVKKDSIDVSEYVKCEL